MTRARGGAEVEVGGEVGSHRRAQREEKRKVRYERTPDLKWESGREEEEKRGKVGRNGGK